MGVGALAAGMAVLAWAVALCVVDLRARRLPNVLTMSGAVVIPAVAAVCGKGAPAVFGALTLSGVYLAVHLVAPAGMGAGDVKLALGLGALTGALGAQVWIPAALTAPVLTAMLGIIGAVRGRRSPIPHGPSMCAASLIFATLAVL